MVEDKEARTWAMLCHLSALSGFVVPFGTIIGPLVVWLIKKEEHPFIDEQGKEALNFQISVLIYFIISLVLVLVLIGFFLMIGLAVFAFIVTIVAAVKANDGVSYRYPMTIRFLK